MPDPIETPAARRRIRGELFGAGGLSKAETERIWLPFDIWLLVATAYLPYARARPWPAVQTAGTLLLVHLLFTNW
ncbi:hypothetical protein HGA13_09875 [Nocardia speluncae]|uniref:Fatty acid desaturase n=1 Tax=Nocardia speluncae TaxID=419477 RepID=A0A846XF92_9NOCA|nr:hypothetical protein [Nocardia speluncae]